MAGQGTTAIELLADVPDLEVIFCPVGGGGQLSGIAVAAKNLKPGIRVIGVEPGRGWRGTLVAAGHMFPWSSREPSPTD